MKIKSGGIIIALTLISLSSRCAAESVSLESLINKAKAGNTMISASKKRFEAAKTVAAQERTPEYPQLFIDYQKMPAGGIQPGKAEEKMFGITQMIPWPGKLMNRGGIAARDADIAELELKTAELDVISQLKSAYAEYFYINKSIESYSETAGLMNVFSKSMESRYASGRASQTEVLQAQVESSKMSNMVLNMKQEAEASKAMINMLTGSAPDAELGGPEEIQPVYIGKNWDEIKNIVLKNSPEIKKLAAGVSKGKLQKKYGLSGFLPDFELTFRKRRMAGEWDGNDFMFGFTAPLWFWKTAGNAKQMSSELEMAEYELKTAEISVIYGARTYFTKIESSRNIIEFYKSGVLPQAEQSKKSAEAEYLSGKGDFLRVLDSIRSLLAFRLEYYKNIAEYNKNLAELEKIAGGELSDGGNK